MLKLLVSLGLIFNLYTIKTAHAFDVCLSAYQSCILDCEESWAYYLADVAVPGQLWKKACYRRAKVMYNACRPNRDLSSFTTCGLSDNIEDRR